MKTSEMKVRCSICKYNRTIRYADGHLSIGCMKASPNGLWPVDIISLDRCPRSHRKRRDNSVDGSELLAILGKIYAQVSVTPDYIPLHTVLKTSGPSVRKKAQHIARALVELEILKVVSRSEKGRKGMRCKYIWNMKAAGPPSLDMVDRINASVQQSVEDATAKEYDKKAMADIKPTKELLVDAGATSCEGCWMREVVNCREKIMAMGLDCKSININSIRYAEATVG